MIKNKDNIIHFPFALNSNGVSIRYLKNSHAFEKRLKRKEHYRILKYVKALNPLDFSFEKPFQKKDKKCYYHLY